MKTERSLSPTHAESADTNSIREQIIRALQSSGEYRHAFVQECISNRLTAQIKALRNDLDYRQFAERIDKKVSWVYRLEDPNATPPTIPTLLEIAEVFDVGLDVRFCRYSELVDDVSTLDDRSFSVPSFEEELKAGAFSSQRKRKRRVRTSQRRKSQGSTSSSYPKVRAMVIGSMQQLAQAS